MLKFAILFSVVACACGAAIPEGMLPQLDGRIIGGSATTIDQHPHQISVQRSGSHSCGGVIYTNRIMITAAHCLQSVSASVLNVRALSSYWNSGGTEVAVTTFRVHEDYKSNTMVNDIALIRLAKSLVYVSMNTAVLPTSAPVDGASAVVTGWGTTSKGDSSIPAQLQQVSVNIISLEKCQSSLYGYGDSVTTTMFCAAATDKGACDGDSGGPLVSDNSLVGIVSWGYGCADANYPGVYTDVSALRYWIIRNASSL